MNDEGWLMKEEGAERGGWRMEGGGWRRANSEHPPLLAHTLAWGPHRRAPGPLTGADSDWPGRPTNRQFRSHVA
jgi:hypothetical protein